MSVEWIERMRLVGRLRSFEGGGRWPMDEEAGSSATHAAAPPLVDGLDDVSDEGESPVEGASEAPPQPEPSATGAAAPPAPPPTASVAPKTTMVVRAMRLNVCVTPETIRVLDDAAVRANRAIAIGTAVLARDTLHALATGGPLLAFWTTSVVEKAFGIATDGYKPQAASMPLVKRLIATRDACMPNVELVERTGVGRLVTDQAPVYAANALTSLKVHVAKRVARLVHVRARLSREVYDALSDDEKKERREDVALACADAIAPPYDPTRHSGLVDLVEGVRATIHIDAWAWYKPRAPKAAADSPLPRRALLDCVEADPAVVVRAMHAINVELAAADAATFAIVPVRTSFVPRFVHVSQDALSDMGLLDTGDVTQGTARKRARKAAEASTAASTAIDTEIRDVHNQIQRIDKQLRKSNVDDATRDRLGVERKVLAVEQSDLKKERRFALVPAELDLKRARKRHATEDEAIKQRKIQEGLDVRAGERAKPTKAEREAAKAESESRKRAREAEIDAIKALIAQQDTGGAAATESKADAFSQVLTLPTSLTKDRLAFADGFATDGFSIRLNVHKRIDDRGPRRSDDTAPAPTKKAKSTPTPTELPKRGLIGVEELANFVKAARGNGTDVAEGAYRDLSPRAQNGLVNALLDAAFGGRCPFRVVGCDPGKRELAVLIDPDVFGTRPADRGTLLPNRPLTTRYTSQQRRHDYTPGRYGLRRKQRAIAQSPMDDRLAPRLKRASMAAAYRAKIEKPAYVRDAEHSMVADAHANGIPIPCAKPTSVDRFDAWLAARERIAPTVRPHYEATLQRKLRWKKHVEHERSVAVFIERLRAFERSTGKQLVIAWGGWGASAGRPGQACNKGSAPAMGVGLLGKVAEHFLVVVVPEGYTTKTCYHCGGKAERCVEIEEARRPERDTRMAKWLQKALAEAGDDGEKSERAQQRHDRVISHRPHVRGVRCCAGCELRISRDKNGGANIGLQGKRFLLGLGTFKPLTERQRALHATSALH